MDKFDEIKLKEFCTNKTNAAKFKKESVNWFLKNLCNKVSDKVLLSEIYKEPI